MEWLLTTQNYGDAQSGIFNFGQDSSFAGTVTAQNNQDANGIGDFYRAVPDGYLALCTDNLPDPSIALPTDHFTTVLWNDVGGDQVTGFATDLTWIKSRDIGSFSHKLTDSVRGATKSLASDLTNAEATDTNGLTSFNADGFTVGDQVDYGTGNMVAWNWKAGGAAVTKAAGNIDGTNPTIASSVSANTTSGFSIVSYTGDADNTSTVEHGLGVIPDLIIIKKRSGTGDWIVGSTSLTSSAAYNLDLNLTDAEQSNVSYFTTAATASVFYPGDGGATNGSAGTYIAYCFASIEGYSKVGKYISNGNADGTFIYTGFKTCIFYSQDSNFH